MENFVFINFDDEIIVDYTSPNDFEVSRNVCGVSSDQLIGCSERKPHHRVFYVNEINSTTTQTPSSSVADDLHQHQHQSSSTNKDCTFEFSAAPDFESIFNLDVVSVAGGGPANFSVESVDESNVQVQHLHPEIKIEEYDDKDNFPQHHISIAEYASTSIVSSSTYTGAANATSFPCPLCGRSFKKEKSLVRHHLATHCGEPKLHTCEECGKKFRQLSTLKQHKVIHSVHRPFTCEFCSKSFNRSSTLISHRKIHSANKPFKCHHCDKAFHQKGNLRNHIYIHTQERPYLCPFCQKGFNQMSNLVSHKTKAHSGEMQSLWACNRCNASFTKRYLLRQHELEQHQIEEPTSGAKKRFGLPPPPPPPPLQQQQQQKLLQINVAPPPAPSAKATNLTSPGFLIPKIQTDAMKTVQQQNGGSGGIAFAVLHLLEGIPLLVRVIDFNSNHSLLRPATTEDYAALQGRSIPVVAAVYQRVINKMVTFSVLPPKKSYSYDANKNSLQLHFIDNGSASSAPPPAAATAAAASKRKPKNAIAVKAKNRKVSATAAATTSSSSAAEAPAVVSSSSSSSSTTPTLFAPSKTAVVASALLRRRKCGTSVVVSPTHPMDEDNESLSDRASDVSEAIQMFATGGLLSPAKVGQHKH